MSSSCNNRLVCCDNLLFDYSINNYPVYTNEEITFFIPCPEGYDCSAPEIEITIPAGTVFYRPTTSEDNTQEHADEELNDLAQQLAEQRALPQLFPKPHIYYNRTYLISCQSGQIGDFNGAIPFMIGEGSVRVDAGTFSSTVSQADADAKAIAQGNLIWNTYANCRWENVEVTVECPIGWYGGPFTVPAGTYSSIVSQEDANAQALAAAQAQADAECADCPTYPVEDLVWAVENLWPGNTFVASGGSGSGSLLNESMNATAELPDSCDPYDITINIPYTLRAPGKGGSPFTFMRFIFLIIDDVIVASDTLNYPAGAGCASKAGTLNVVHTIGPDAFSNLNGYHKLYIYVGQDTSGLPDSPTCMTEFTFTITPLTPP